MLYCLYLITFAQYRYKIGIKLFLIFLWQSSNVYCSSTIYWQVKILLIVEVYECIIIQRKIILFCKCKYIVLYLKHDMFSDTLALTLQVLWNHYHFSYVDMNRFIHCTVFLKFLKLMVFLLAINFCTLDD